MNKIYTNRPRNFNSKCQECSNQPELKCNCIRNSLETSHSLSRIPFLPLLSIRTNAIEENYKEIKELKLKISEQEEKNKINSQCIDVNAVKISELEQRYLKLKKKSGIGCSYEERKEEACNKLKFSEAEWKKSVSNLQETVKSLENQLARLDSKADSIKNTMFKQDRQLRLIKKPKKSSSHSGKKFHSCEKSETSIPRTIISTPSWGSSPKKIF